MTIPLLRFRLRILSLVLITLTALHSTIAKPLELGEGESTSEKEFDESSMSLGHVRYSNLEKPRQQPFNGLLGLGSNIQINSRDEAEQEDHTNSETRRSPLLSLNQSSKNSHERQKQDQLNDEQFLDELSGDSKSSEKQLRDMNNIRILEDTFELVNPKYITSVALPRLEESALSSDDETNPVSGGEVSDGEPNDQKEEFIVNVPRQDEGEEDENLPALESMKAEDSNNIAYSYSSYVPSYQIAPNGFHQAQQLNYLVDQYGDHQLAPMSFVFHPTVLRGTRPNVVLRQLQQFAYQLDQSPIMNALFSPSTVPIPPNSPAWPSKFEAQKYLPPKSDQIRNSPNLRRTVMQINVDDLNPQMFQQLQQNPGHTIAEIIRESLSRNAAAFTDAMNQKMNFPPPQAVSQSFDARANQYYNNQLQVPQFPTFPNFNEHQFQGNSQPNLISQFHMPFPKIPYISPNLRQPEPTDGIDSGASVIQIGTGNKNIATHETVQLKPEVEDELEEKLKEVSMLNENLNNQDGDDAGLLDPEGDTHEKDDEYTDPSTIDIVSSDADEHLYSQPMADQLDVDKNELDGEMTSEAMADENSTITTSDMPVIENSDQEFIAEQNLEDESDEGNSTQMDGLEIMNQIKEIPTKKPELNSRSSKNEKLDEPIDKSKLSQVANETPEATTETESATVSSPVDQTTLKKQLEASIIATESPETTTVTSESMAELLPTTVPNEAATKCLEDDPEKTTESMQETTTFGLDDGTEVTTLIG